MARIFALQGASNCGKSSTLIQLLSQITAKYPNAAVQSLHVSSTEITVIVHPVNGQTIGIESHGDPNSLLQQSLSNFRAANCDIIFCACRTSGMTVNWVNAMSPPDTVQFVRKARVQTGQPAANALMAASLMTLAGI